MGCSPLLTILPQSLYPRPSPLKLFISPSNKNKISTFEINYSRFPIISYDLQPNINRLSLWGCSKAKFYVFPFGNTSWLALKPSLFAITILTLLCTLHLHTVFIMIVKRNSCPGKILVGGHFCQLLFNLKQAWAFKFLLNRRSIQIYQNPVSIIQSKLKQSRSYAEPKKAYLRRLASIPL